MGCDCGGMDACNATGTEKANSEHREFLTKRTGGPNDVFAAPSIAAEVLELQEA
jgi:hypothetical protein